MYDLHIHTTCSDGKYSRLELLRRMNKSRFQVASFTDHNYFADDTEELNHDYVSRFKEEQGVPLINGTELDIQEYPRLHILGYDMKSSDYLERVLLENALENKNRCRFIVRKIYAQYGIYIPFRELEAMAFNGFVTKNIIVQWLIDNKYAKSVYEAGMLYTSKYSPCYVERASLKLGEAIELINSSGGISVMAHPSSMKLSDSDLFDFMSHLKQIGIQGIEVYNADKTNDSQLKSYLAMAHKLELLTTSGSDFHREEETKVFGVDNNHSNGFMKLIRERRKVNGIR